MSFIQCGLDVQTCVRRRVFAPAEITVAYADPRGELQPPTALGNGK